MKSKINIFFEHVIFSVFLLLIVTGVKLKASPTIIPIDSFPVLNNVGELYQKQTKVLEFTSDAATNTVVQLLPHWANVSQTNGRRGCNH